MNVPTTKPATLKQLTAIVLIALFILTSCGEKSADNKSSRKHDLGPPPKKPDFTSFTDVKDKKQAFFDYMYFFIEKVNLEVLDRRFKIEEILNKKPSSITEQERAFISELSELYLKDHDSSNTIKTAKILQPYIRVIPPSLALAQAANESAWGTSRFATDANNYFGQWCFIRGCGLVPKQRSDDQVHEVRKFKSPEGSVRSYIRNLNTHFTYDDFRRIRDQLYQQGKLVTGLELAEGLTGYSERGEEYVKELKSLIRINNLTEFDRQFWESVTNEK